MSQVSGPRERSYTALAVSRDDVDRRIIVLLQEDGRMSAPDISRRLGDIGDRALEGQRRLLDW